MKTKYLAVIGTALLTGGIALGFSLAQGDFLTGKRQTLSEQDNAQSPITAKYLVFMISFTP